MINGHLAFLKRLYSVAINDDLAETNPVRKVELSTTYSTARAMRMAVRS